MRDASLIRMADEGVHPHVPLAGAALHVADAAPTAKVALVSKGIVGKSGCTQMVQGGFNAAVRKRRRAGALWG